jgi:glutamyl-tRNA synthetase
MPAHGPRCRFAPSPTGFLHVGSAQSALFNWLFARRTGGAFLLRIEDTDAERNRPELTDNILDMLRWLGLDWDDGEVHQSDRAADHVAAALRLADTGHAYWCDCTAEDVAARNKAAGGKPGYDGFCRDRGLSAGEGRALRFRAPDDGVTAWDDLIRGKVSFDNSTIEDFVLLRSNRTPTFLIANVADDAFMAITHVIRGEDHVNGTPKYLLLRAALGLADAPTFAHLPLLVNEQRKKLSKRRDDVSVADYKAKGYLPEAMRNYLALLGWGPPDGVEVRPIEEIVELFRLEDVNPSPAFFDRRKLDHVNGEWIRRLDVHDFEARAAEFLPDGPSARAALHAIAPLVQERVRTLADVNAYVDFLYLDEPVLDERDFAKHVERLEDAGSVLARLIGALGAAEWTPAGIERSINSVAAASGYENPRKVHALVRVPVTGRAVGPPLWESLAVLGRDRTVARLEAAKARLG